MHMFFTMYINNIHLFRAVERAHPRHMGLSLKDQRKMKGKKKKVTMVNLQSIHGVIVTLIGTRQC